MSNSETNRNNARKPSTMGVTPSRDAPITTHAESTSATKGISSGDGNKATQSGGETRGSAAKQSTSASASNTTNSTSGSSKGSVTASSSSQAPPDSSTSSRQGTTGKPLDDMTPAANRPVPEYRITRSSTSSSQREGLVANTTTEGNQISGNLRDPENQQALKTKSTSSGSSFNKAAPTNRSESSTSNQSATVLDPLEDVRLIVKTLQDQVEQQKYALNKSQKSTEERLQKLEDSVNTLFQRLEEAMPLPPPQQQQRRVETAEAPTETQIVGNFDNALEKRFAQLEVTLQKQFGRLDQVLLQQFGKLESVNMQALQEREQEQEGNMITTTQSRVGRGVVAAPSLPPVRRHAPKTSEFEISDRDVEQRFGALDSCINDLLLKHLDDPSNAWRKTITDEPWATLSDAAVSKNRVPWLRALVANMIYDELFTAPFFGFDDDEIETGLVKFEDWLKSESFEGDQTEATRWLVQTVRIAEDQHRKQKEAAETKFTKYLSEQIRMHFPIRTDEKANRAVRRVCHEAVACALMLHGGHVYSWEQQDGGAASQTSVKVGDVQQIGPFLLEQNGVGGSGEHKVAFTVFGAVIKDYFTTVNDKPVRGRAIIKKASVVLY